MESLEELALLQNQVDEFRLKDKLGKKNFHEKVKQLRKPFIDTIETASDNLTKTISETYNDNNKAIEKLNEKVLELMNDKGLVAPYLACSLVNIFKSEKRSHFR